MRKSFYKLVATMLLCSTGWSTARAFTVDDLNYEISSDFAVVTGPARANLTTVIIPETVSLGENTYPVQEIGYEAFWRCKTLSEVKFPQSLRTIHAGVYVITIAGNSFKVIIL